MSVLDLKPARPRPRSTGSTRGRRAAKTSAKYLWRSSKWVAKQGWRHRVALAPAYGTAATYALALTEHAIGGGGTIVAAAGSVGGLALWRWRDGLPTPTRLAELDPHERHLDITAWSSLVGVTGLGIITAHVGTPLPMPGVWGLAAVATTAGWFALRATRPVDVRALETTRVNEIWEKRVAAKRGAIPESTLGKITKVDGRSLIPEGHLGPVVERSGWTATVTLPDVGAAAKSVITPDNTARIAAAYKTAAMNIILAHTESKSEDKVQITVMTRTATADTISYDPDIWQVNHDGCVPIAVCADGTVPQLRVWEPDSGSSHTFIAGTTGSGKSRATELVVTQAVSTGRVVPIVADPQRGASLPAWGGQSGVAPAIARDPDEIVALFAALTAVADERADFLARLGASAWDADTMLREYGRPIIMTILDEAHMVLQGGGNEKMKMYVEVAAKVWRKLGMGIVLITQTPNLEQVGGSQAIRDNLTAYNRISLRTGSRATGGMVLPPSAPDPYAIPQMIGKHSTKGMCSIATSAPFGDVTNYARFPYLPDDVAKTEAVRLARDVMPDLDPAAAKLLGVDIPAWRKRVDEIADGTAEPDATESTLVKRERTTIKARIVEYLEARRDKAVETAQVVADLDLKPQTVSTTLRRLADEGHVQDHGHGLWQAK